MSCAAICAAAPRQASHAAKDDDSRQGRAHFRSRERLRSNDHNHEVKLVLPS